jgi:outer membrane protein insertion porin family
LKRIRSAKIRTPSCLLLGPLLLLGVAATVTAADELDYGLAEHKLAKIVLSGNATFTDEELKALLPVREPSWLRPLSTARYRPDLIEVQLRILTRFYQQNGFHQVQVGLDSIGAASEGRGDVLYLSIEEGPQTVLSEVRFVGAGPLAEDYLRRHLQYLEGSPVPADLNDLGGDLYNLRALYREQAYLRVKVEPSLEVPEPSADDDPRRAILEYRIEPGLFYRIDHIVIEGNERTRVGLIRRELKVAEGDPFAWRDIEISRRRLLETALLRDVGFTPANIDTVQGKADLAVRVVERRPAYYELGAGVGSRERVRLLGAWGHNNLWGSGRRLFVRGKIYWNVEEIIGSLRPKPRPEFNYRADILYINPHLRGSRFRLDVNLYLEKETRGESGLNLQTRGFWVGTQFHGGQKVLNTVAIQVEESDPRLHQDAPEDLARRFAASGVSKSQTRSLVYTVYEENRDDIFRPRQGSRATAQLEVAGGWLAGDNDFVKVIGGWHGYTPVPWGGVLAFRASAGLARPYSRSFRERGEDGVPYAERFFAGGASSVRGYQESSLGPQITDPAQLDSLQFASDVPLPNNPARGGNYLLLTNVEWRFPLPFFGRWKLGGVLFLDGGNVWERAKDIRLRGFRLRSFPRQPDDPMATKLWDYRYGVGTGLRLDTPFGPLRVDVGFPLKRAPGEDKSVVHFSLGYPF